MVHRNRCPRKGLAEPVRLKRILDPNQERSRVADSGSAINDKMQDRKFYVLDAMRGIAAFAVVQLHTQSLFGKRWFDHAVLAVDFFFMLSGFVLCFAYQNRLDQGWSTRDFLKARFIRLYPLYFLGLAVAALFYLLRSHVGNHGGEITGIKFLFVLGIFLLPAPPSLAARGVAFPLNPATWSLFFELLANIAHAVFLRKRPIRQIAAILVVCAFAFAACAVKNDTIDCGYSEDRFLYAASRIAFSYTAGIFLCLCWHRWKIPGNVSPFIPALLLVAVLAGPRSSFIWYDLLAIYVAFPAILYLGASSHPAPWLLRPTHWMGITSYSVYVLHSPFSQWYEMLHRKVLRNHVIALPWPGVGFLCLLAAIAVAADRFYDKPVRAFLRARTGKSRPIPAR
jgi:peptidoglycan/LPS O-acetylase OafA/YrhL